MAGIKPNEFPAIIGALDGTEEVYSQRNGINEKYTVQQIWDGITSSGQTLSQTLGFGNKTNGKNIVMSNGDVIKALNGGGQLNLREGSNNIVSLTNDNAGYTKAWFYLDDTQSWVGFNNTQFLVGDKHIDMNMSSAFGYIHFGKLGLGDATNLGGNEAGLVIANITNTGVTHGSSDGTALFLNSGSKDVPTIFNQDVNHSVASGGIGLNVKTDYSNYMNQACFQSSGNTFEVVVKPATITSDREQIVADADGVICVHKVIEVNTTHFALDGQVIGVTTGAGNVDVILPDASIPNMRITIKNLGGAGQVNVKALGLQTIDGVSTKVLNTKWQFIVIYSTGTEWWVVGLG